MPLVAAAVARRPQGVEELLLVRVVLAGSAWTDRKLSRICNVTPLSVVCRISAR